MKTYSKFLVLIVNFFVVLTVLTFSVQAGGPPPGKGQVNLVEEETPYRIEQLLHTGLKVINKIIALPRTTTDFFSSMMTNTVSTIFFGMNPDDLGTCGTGFLYTVATSYLGDSKSEVLGLVDLIFDEDVLIRAQGEAEALGCELMCNGNSLIAKGNGSVMQLAQRGLNVMATEPVPVSFAYYFKHNLQKIPVVNRTAYAQTSYNAWGLELTLGLWETSRNIAYAMMAIIMLVIGMMIIARKKINPQTAVTVQTAIPRVVISLILITFSYPIGALLASLIGYLIALVLKLFFGSIFEAAVNNALLNPQNLFDVCKLIFYMPILMVAMGGIGLVSVFTGILLIGLLPLALLVIFIKMMVIYMKIMLEIVMAPLQFAFAAIPGQEDIITDWFKRMIANVLAIPAIWFFLVLSWYIILKPLLDPEIFVSFITKPSVIMPINLFRTASSSALTIAMLPVLSVMTMFYALGADKKIKEFILGAQGPKKRK